MPPSDVVTRASWRQGRRGRRRQPLVARRCGRLYRSDVFRCWRKTCKTASRRLTGDLLAPVINGPVTFADVTGVAERKLTTHPPLDADPRRVHSHVPPLASSTRATDFAGNQKRHVASGTSPHDFRKRCQFLDLISSNRKAAGRNLQSVT